MSNKVVKAVYKEDDLSTSNHYHDCHQILFITDGEVDVHRDGGVYTAKCGQILFFNRFEEHLIRVNKAINYKRFVLNISPKVDESVPIGYKKFSVLFNRPVGLDIVLDVGNQFSVFESIFTRIVEEVDKKDDVNEDMLCIYLQELLLNFLRYFPERFSYFEDEKGELVYKIQKEFEVNYSTEVSLEDLSKKYNISQSYLSHVFKEITGKSVKGYLLACRIAAAKKYLAKTDKRISEVVELCGFSDSSNFGRIFRKITGLSPVEFRRKYYNKEFVMVD